MRVTADGRRQAAAIQGRRQCAGRLARDNRRGGAGCSDVEAHVSHKRVLDAVCRICAQIRRSRSKSYKLPGRVERRPLSECIRGCGSVARRSEERRRRASRRGVARASVAHVYFLHSTGSEAEICSQPK